MNNIKMDRLQLLKIVEQNMSLHITEYDEAMIGYHESLKAVLQQNMMFFRKELKAANEGIKLNAADIKLKTKSLPVMPISYQKEYERAKRMLELSVETVIDIEEAVFNQLVLDEWSWKTTFITINSAYTKG